MARTGRIAASGVRKARAGSKSVKRIATSKTTKKYVRRAGADLKSVPARKKAGFKAARAAGVKAGTRYAKQGGAAELKKSPVKAYAKASVRGMKAGRGVKKAYRSQTTKAGVRRVVKGKNTVKAAVRARKR